MDQDTKLTFQCNATKEKYVGVNSDLPVTEGSCFF